MQIDSLQPILSSTIDWISNNPAFAYITILLISLSESLVVIGLIVPGIAIMSIIGALIGSGVLSLWPTMLAAIIGAIIGDGISYWIGVCFQDKIRNWYIFQKFPGLITRCENFFIKHGGKSVVIGRFVGPVRPMIPAIAGMMKMPAQHFYTVNILSAFLWAPVYLLPGMLFGTTLASLPADVSEKLVILVCAIFVTFWFIKKIITFLWRRYNIKIRKISNKIWFYTENNSLTLLNKLIRHPLAHKKHQVDSFIQLIIITLLTIVFTLLTSYRLFTTNLNAFFKHLAIMLTPDNVENVFYNIVLVLNNLSSAIPLSIIFIITTVYLSLKYKLKSHLILSLGLLIIYYLAGYAIAYLTQYPEPFISAKSIFTLSSVPNVEIGLITLLIGYISIIKYCLHPTIHNKSNFIFYGSLILSLFTIIKLYLGLAWLTDIIIAILLSGCLLLAFCIVYWQNPVLNINNKKFNIFLLFIFSGYIAINCINFSINETYYYQNFLAVKNNQYSYNLNGYNINETAWQKQSNLFHNLKKPIINIQWLSSDRENIIKFLEKNNWYQNPELNFDSMLNFLQKKPDITKLPILPVYYLDHHASLNYSKVEKNNKIINLRLWQTEYRVGSKPLWIGTVEYLKPRRFFNFVTLFEHWPRAEFSDVTENFTNSLTKNKINYKIISDNQQNLVDSKLDIILIN